VAGIPGDTFMQKDIETLTTLNHDFVKSVQGADVKRFDEILAKDFLFTNPDGSLYNRAEFLDLIGKGASISELREDQVNVRLFGDFAIIHARIQYRSKAGIERIGRYTDTWARRDGKWLCVAAQTSGEDL
jgi:ketosteroid isomerase-like protein